MSDKILQLDPAKVKASENVRFGLKRYRLDRLKDEIAEAGGVMVPVTVTALDNDPDGFEYLIETGHYRHASVLELNKAGAGLTLPAMSVGTVDPVARIKRQIAENQERENFSPMDRAQAMKKLLDAGVPKVEVRRIFAVPGGRKGIKIQPASNSYVNMHLSFLELTKGIQNKIHDGILTVGAAYDLTKHAKTDWEEIVKKAEAARDREIEKEESEEKKLLTEEKKAIETEQAVETKKGELSKTEEELAAAKADHEAKSTATAAAFKAKGAIGIAAEQRKELEKAYKEAEAAQKDARKAVEDLTKDHAKLKADTEKKEAAAQKVREKLDAARAAKKKAKDDKAASSAPSTTPIKRKDVQKAGNQVAPDKASPVKLNANEMREVINNLALPGGSPKVMAFATIVAKVFSGEITEKVGKKQLDAIK